MKQETNNILQKQTTNNERRYKPKNKDTDPTGNPINKQNILETHFQFGYVT